MERELDILPTSALDHLPPHRLSDAEIDDLSRQAIETLRHRYKKILVLDDDPTGSQTVYDIPVYTEFSPGALEEVRLDQSQVVYVLTNSRSLDTEQTEELHRRLIRNWRESGRAAGNDSQADNTRTDDTLIISRSDSTLRGHYPLETDIIAEEAYPDGRGAVTVLLPFFPEGGRFTFGEIHYVQEGNSLIPAAQTEFAADSSFGYSRSHLPSYVEEKTGRRIAAGSVHTIGIPQLRSGDIEAVTQVLTGAAPGNVVVVNATDYSDLKIFTVALARACESSGRYVFRSAASLVKVLAGLENRPLLTHSDLTPSAHIEMESSATPGLLVAGSYVSKTTKQLAKLVEASILMEVKLNIRKALYADRFPAEVDAVRQEVQTHLAARRSVCLYTTNAGRREFLRADEGEEGLTDLELSARISTGLVDIVAGLETAPSWIITKGGITSHDIACRSLKIRKAMVLGQILPGVPVWRCGPEARWPGIPLVIFPGNVGSEGALTEAVQTLAGKNLSKSKDS